MKDETLSPAMAPSSREGLPETVSEAICGQAAAFDAAAAGDLRADLQFCITGREPGDYVLRIANGHCTAHTGRTSLPALTVHAPSEVWLQIAQGELSGSTAYIKGLFRAEGDMRLLMRMGELFSRKGKAGQGDKPEEKKGSTTALLLAYCRGYHAEHDAPKIFDDFMAYALLKKEERAAFDQMLTPTVQAIETSDPAGAAACRDQADAHAWSMRTIAPLSLAVSRSRYTEDNLAQAVGEGVGQYVILGAGLDTFAFRCPEMLKQLQVFEIDHPATQALKRRRIIEAGWEKPDRLRFVPVDFTKESLAAALSHSTYDPRTPAFFSWLGVTYYLSHDAVFATLRAIAEIAPPGSSVIFDYFDAEAFVPGKATKRMQIASEYTRKQGEPIITGFNPSTLAAELAAAGLRLEENLTPADIEARYFRGRTDNYHAYDFAHFARAVVE
jgi:methyltransferase (TIGR00027 family)